MRSGKRKKIIRLLGIGFDAEDGHTRITNGENYDVLMGSSESHEYIQQLIEKIEAGLIAKNLSLNDMTPDEFSEFIQKIK